jgi:putative GTP pyrophosphokinase
MPKKVIDEIHLQEVDELKLEYTRRAQSWNQLRLTVSQQLGEILGDNEITLVVPIESRVKSWDSIREKVERKTLSLDSLDELNDVVGVRAILLFRNELTRSHRLIHDNFDVIESEDVATRLSAAQFGYQSQHYIIRLPKTWLHVPTMKDLSGLKVEIQIRTLAQHVWAAASHKLQYKHEQSVPPPILRTINRIAALLETVDLEFDRVLDERLEYHREHANSADGNAALNVENLAILLDELLPPQNKKAPESYEDLLSDLSKLKVETIGELKAIWTDECDAVMQREAEDVKRRFANGDYEGSSEDRIKSGVFKTHAGLIRTALRFKFGDTAIVSATGKTLSASGFKKLIARKS